MKKTYLLVIFILTNILFGCQQKAITTTVAEHPKTFCNPVNIDYRFMKIPKGAGIREAADPVVTQFKGKYYLFASKSSGYWSSTDFVNWKHIVVPDSILPVEQYAPSVYEYNDSLYYLGPSHGMTYVYRTDNPESGIWEKHKALWTSWDPAFWLENGKIYLYYGCSPKDPIYMNQLDLATYQLEKEKVACLNSDVIHHGWERFGERNEMKQNPWIEGAWMTKYNGKYYLQYATPATQYKTYADGVYLADSPEGPFTYAYNSPVSAKATGFIGGAGHGCLFKIGKNYWKAATNSVSVRNFYERRISFYPAGFDASDDLYTDTYLGDYPMFLPSDTIRKSSRPDWMLLSYKKPVVVSSTEAGEANNLVDEDVRSSWVAASNTDQEWAQVDLGKECQIHAIQVNYDEYGATWKGYQKNLYQSYNLYASYDGHKWYLVADKSTKKTDTPHDYIEFETPFKARYIKWQNKAYTVSDNVSLRELRIFGKSEGEKPAKVDVFQYQRDANDRCRLRLSWDPVQGADGYIIREGIRKDNLFHNYQVNDSTHYLITTLNSDIPYYITIDSYNEHGVTRGSDLQLIK